MFFFGVFPENLRIFFLRVVQEVPRQLQEPTGLSAAFVQVHSSRLQRLCSTFLATHPAYELLHCDLHVTAAKRAKIFMDRGPKFGAHESSAVPVT